MKPHHEAVANDASLPTNRQRVFVRYFIAIMVDLLVLGLAAQYWDRVSVDLFSSALIAAILLQALLQFTLTIEHRAAAPFAGKTSLGAKFGKLLVAWLILFISKLIMLWAIGFILGGSVQFHGPTHGALAFILVVIVMVTAEAGIFRLYRALGTSEAND